MDRSLGARMALEGVGSDSPPTPLRLPLLLPLPPPNRFSKNFGMFLSGILLMGVGIFIIVYAWFVFRMRSIKLRRREAGPYDDQVGPTLLVILLVAALGVSLYATLAYDDDDDDTADAAAL